MKTREELHDELRKRILALPGVTERQNAGLPADLSAEVSAKAEGRFGPQAGIHEDAFFVGRAMFMHIHGFGHCDIRLPKDVQERVLAEGKARHHRWAPEAGYVTFIVRDKEDLEQAMELIRISHDNITAKTVPQS